MKITKRTFNFSVKESKNYNSVSIEEGFEAEVGTPFDEINFQKMKKEVKDKIKMEVRNELERM